VPRCAPQAQIILGDARLKLAEQPDGWFDVLLIDAFSSDAIPTHMITKEAMALYMSKMKDDGVLIVHISNRYLDLTQIVADAAHSLGFPAMLGDRDGDPGNEADTGVRAVIVSKSLTRLLQYQPPVWTLIPEQKRPDPWTDDHTDVVRAIMEHGTP
jgi:hypothetical protein